MVRTIFSGSQDFADIRERGCFYVDKTDFIRAWWSAGDPVSLITRPLGFGKTLMLSAVRCFFSTEYAGRSDLFKGLAVWNNPAMRSLQGTYPVIFLSMSKLKCADNAADAHALLCDLIMEEYSRFYHEFHTRGIMEALQKLDTEMVKREHRFASEMLTTLCWCLQQIYGKRVIILCDDYDAPYIHARQKGFGEDLVGFMRGFMISVFKVNRSLERAILIGETWINPNDLDLNNICVRNCSSPFYTAAFGFTRGEVLAAMDEYGRTGVDTVAKRYGGYVYGSEKDISSACTIIDYLKHTESWPWWRGIDPDGLVGKTLLGCSREVKQSLVTLLNGGSITTRFAEQFTYDFLPGSTRNVWGLLISKGYLAPVPEKGWTYEPDRAEYGHEYYELKLTNDEARKAIEDLIRFWFGKAGTYFKNFLEALKEDDLDYMNNDMNCISRVCFSSFDTNSYPDRTDPENFIYSFVLGLLVELRGSYIITSNRESGRGRYDVTLEPRDSAKDDAIIIEFKVRKSKTEASLEDTVAAALAQIEEKRYAQQLVERGVPKDRIRKYGFAFQGKEVLIGQA